MSSVGLREFLRQLMICSEKAACIGRQIRSMQTDFHGFIQEKQREYLFFKCDIEDGTMILIFSR